SITFSDSPTVSFKIQSSSTYLSGSLRCGLRNLYNSVVLGLYTQFNAYSQETIRHKMS
ncbi:19307_t:CDS:1, partial [Dentiscutata erythropus]